MQTPFWKSKFFALLIILVALVALVTVFYFYNSEPEVATPISPKNPLVPGEIRQVSQSEVPPGFPQEFLMPQASALLVKNYNQMNEDGGVLAVRQYLSGQDLDQNLSFVAEALYKGGWITIHHKEDKNLITITADRGEERVHVVLKYDGSSNKTSVLVSHLIMRKQNQ